MHSLANWSQCVLFGRMRADIHNNKQRNHTGHAALYMCDVCLCIVCIVDGYVASGAVCSNCIIATRCDGILYRMPQLTHIHTHTHTQLTLARARACSWEWAFQTKRCWLNAKRSHRSYVKFKFNEITRMEKKKINKCRKHTKHSQCKLKWIYYMWIGVQVGGVLHAIWDLYIL